MVAVKWFALLPLSPNLNSLIIHLLVLCHNDSGISRIMILLPFKKIEGFSFLRSYCFL